MGNETYKRGQVEWAIWAVVTQQRATASDPPTKFLIPIKRLLEIDRRAKRDFAFSSGRTEGHGVDAQFSPFDAFCLALAWELLGAGLKPSKVVALLQKVRPELEKPFAAIVRAAERLVAARRDGSWSAADESETRFFMVLAAHYVEEIGRFFTKLAPRDEPSLVLLRGFDQLTAELAEMRSNKFPNYRRALVIEIGGIASVLWGVLPEAPLTRRGRK